MGRGSIRVALCIRETMSTTATASAGNSIMAYVEAAYMLATH